jgi:hypothetical protein
MPDPAATISIADEEAAVGDFRVHEELAIGLGARGERRKEGEFPTATILAATRASGVQLWRWRGRGEGGGGPGGGS